MKNIILKFIREKKGSVSFIEIENLFKKHNFDYKGNCVLRSPFNEHIVIWEGWSEKALELISELENEDLIFFTGGCIFAYMVDGKFPSLPIAKKDYPYKTDHWLPTFINLREMN